ncbi:nitrous oxide-stimulated promoter family protein [Vibrio algarum]|uniref:Nitrous oxide-stimulated promoter family protein n=1 Tax=Vibrio algarum TaxID=3020714 RepID=A0ABT4YXF7_9VIBR|nr:nitrous oxide-stimulated promoter family protein [Vibrio sp. KJ40-1]MDB1126241.1 nitrous oxide-stimulated promoter family protein [Vibrio sp. KJ40-1]
MRVSKILQGELATEYKTVSAMMEIYCQKNHGIKGGLCDSCSELLIYAETKLDRCPYGQEKPTCNNCPIHCYKPEPKEDMRLIMRYSGPRMLFKHPILAIRHLRHEKREVPNQPKKQASNRHNRMKAMREKS